MVNHVWPGDLLRVGRRRGEPRRFKAVDRGEETGATSALETPRAGRRHRTDTLEAPFFSHGNIQGISMVVHVKHLNMSEGDTLNCHP